MDAQTIKRLKVSCIKGIKQVEILADPICNELAGQNGAGKSSVLSSIEYALAGKRAIDSRALREGEAKGEIVIETDDLLITRRFKEGSSPTLTIKALDGEGKFGQRDLDSLWSSFTFDPLSFSRMKPAEQVEVLQQLAGADYCASLAEKDAQIREAEDDRRLTNREIGRYGAMPALQPVEPVDIAALSAELRAAEEWNNIQEQRRLEAQRLQSAIAMSESRMQQISKELEEARAHHATLLEQEKTAIPTELLRDTHPLHAALAQAGEQNRRAEEYRAGRERLAQQQALSRKSNELDSAIERLRSEREQLAKCVSFPVPGLSFSSDGIRVNGLPFEQLSSSEQIRISARIGMSTNAALRIMLVKDGSLLDTKSWAELVAVAEEHGYQLWIETVGEGHGDAIVLEAGELRRESAEQVA